LPDLRLVQGLFTGLGEAREVAAERFDLGPSGFAPLRVGVFLLYRQPRKPGPAVRQQDGHVDLVSRRQVGRKLK
jgi:hypothetical protein